MDTSSNRVFLLLQGHPSLFWRRLSEALESAGHRVLKIHFCAGDWAFWNGSASNYKGRLEDWPTWLSEYLRIHEVTDILYYADRLPYHVDALAVGQAMDVECWAVEHGYLRPDWLTLEPDAMGANSTFPRDWPAISNLADGKDLPDMTIRFRHAFAKEAFGEVLFNLLMVFGRPFYRNYVSDKVHWPPIDYLSWLRELAKSPIAKHRARRLEQAFLRDQTPYNLVAMQLTADYQIRASSHYHHLKEFLREVIVSFAQAAPFERHLVIKLHPLDNGLDNWRRLSRRWIARAGLKGKVHFIKGGDLDRLIDGSCGVVYVNSTVGLHAIQRGKPSIAMGQAVFDLPGLTHQGGLDTFWQSPEPVEPACVDTFLRALTCIQVKGSFFNRAGQNIAVNEMVTRLTAPVTTDAAQRELRPEPDDVNPLQEMAQSA